MENASKALEIAAGVLLGILIMSLIAYFFTNISSWPEQQDNEKELEQTAQFNLEFEVYDKKGMYGADVISCLGKAVNNNEKYYEGGSFISGKKYGEQYWVNVYVNLKSCLKEEIYVYHYATTGIASADKGLYTQEQRFSNPLDKNNNEMNLKLEIFGFSFEGYTDFSNDDKLNYDERKGKTLVRVLNPKNSDLNIASNKLIDANSDATKVKDEKTGLEYNAWLYSKKTENGKLTVNMNSKTPLQELIKTADSNVKEIVTNTSNNKDSLQIWSTAEWRTALYDFKTRKFKCDNVKYNETTGRVYELYFSEME